MAHEPWRALTNPSKKEKSAQNISIECVDDTDDDGYIVCVTPKKKNDKPGKESKGYTYVNPVRKVFTDKKSVMSYLDEIL